MPINKKNLPGVIARVKNKIKEWVFENWAADIKHLSYGCAAYPEDGTTGDALLNFSRNSSIGFVDELRKKKILIADDDRSSQAMLELLLKQLGYQNIDMAYDGSEALFKIKAGVPESSITFHDEYPLTLLRALRPYDLESMTFIPAKEAPAQSDNPHVGVSAVAGRESAPPFFRTAFEWVRVGSGC